MGLFARVVPAPVLKSAKSMLRWWEGQPQVHGVNFGDLRQLRPVSRAFGCDRGLAIDRYYIERFLDARRADIRGRVLEIGDNTYTTRFGGGLVSHSDVLHVNDRNPKATIVGDLTDLPQVADDCFDCMILTQTLQFIFDLPAAVRTLNRILAPGGVLLVTVPGMSQIADSEWGTTWYWAFTSLAIQRLLREGMPTSGIDVVVHGNVLAATAFLQGLAASELTDEELGTLDPQYQLLITARAAKGQAVP
jgi:SAM-dependent methyltransferase